MCANPHGGVSAGGKKNAPACLNMNDAAHACGHYFADGGGANGCCLLRTSCTYYNTWIVLGSWATLPRAGELKDKKRTRADGKTTRM